MPSHGSGTYREQEHSFFQSGTFTALLHAAQRQPKKFKVYEKGGTLRVSVQDVKNPSSWPGQAVQQAKVALESVVG